MSNTTSAYKYVFTPCCPELPTLEFDAAGVVYPGFDPDVPQVWIYNNECYTITYELTVSGSLPTAPPFGEVTSAGPDCEVAAENNKECVCEEVCYILYQCADIVPGTPLRFATTTDLSAYVGQSVTLDEYPGACYIVQERTDAEIDSTLCLNAIPVTLAAVQDCNCTCTCFFVRSKTSIIYTDCDGKVIRGIVPGAVGLKICSITYPISDQDDIISIEEKGECVEGICPSECYILEDCDGIKDPIYTTSQSILPYIAANQIVEIEGYEGCWIPSPSEVCDCAVDVVVVRYHDDCTACTGFDAYKLVNCDNEDQIIYTTTDLSAYVNQTVELDECEGCWKVESIDIEPPTDSTVTVTFTHEDCNTCKKTYWLLTDCDNDLNTLVTYTDLSTYENQVITLDYCPETCWLVTSTRLSENAQLVVLESNYEDCTTCFLAVNPPICRTIVPTQTGTISYIDTAGDTIQLAVTVGVRTEKLCVRKWLTGSYEDELLFGECINGECPTIEYKSRSVQPGYDTPACRPDYYEKVVCNFGEAIYREVLEERYGISNCCPQDLDKWDVKKELLYLEALKDPDYECATSSTGSCNTSGYVQPNCEPVDPFILYNFIVENEQGYPSFIVTYRDQEGQTQTITTPECIFDGKTPCPGISFQFCAEYGSIRIDSVLSYANNETCPTASCVQSEYLTYIEPCEPL